jgi:hypothetical protein
MKMKKLFSVSLIVIAMLFLSTRSFAALSFNMELKNVVQVNECTFRFDVYLQNTSATPAIDVIAIEGYMFQLGYNPAILNGGAFNNNYCTYVTGTSQFDVVVSAGEAWGVPNLPVSARVTSGSGVVQCSSNASVPGDVLTYIDNNTPLRIGTFQVILKTGSGTAISKNFASVAPNFYLVPSGAILSTTPVTLTDVSADQNGSIMKYTRTGSSFTTIVSRTLTNPSTQTDLYSFLFTGPGAYSDITKWNNAVGATGVSYHTLPTAGANISGWTAASLTITGITASNKVYNGTNAATLNGGTLVGVAGGDVVTLVPGIATFVDKNAGTGKTVTATGYTLGGADAAKYTLSQPSGITADITKAPLTVTGVTASDKVYDGALNATLTGGSLTGVLGSEVVTLVPGTGSFVDKNAGTGKAITATAYSLSGADAANYSVSQPTGITANITKAPLTITGVTASNKVYDGTNTAALTVGTLSGKATGDVVNLVAGNGTFADKNFGTAKAVTASVYSISGTDANNYTLGAQPSGLTANITKAPLTITGVTAANKAYDGTLAAVLSGGALSGKAAGDVVMLTAGTGAFASKTPGTAKTVTASGYLISGTDVANYTLSQPSGITATITATPLTIIGVTASNKVYNGGLDATLTGGSLTGVLGSEVVTLVPGTGSFVDKNAGSGKAITATAYSLSGADAANYSVSQPTGITANITNAPLTITGVTASNKVYDGGNTATLTVGTLSGKVTGDVVTLVAGNGTFADKNFGTAKAVTASGYSITGTDANNYTLGAQPSGLTANITKAPLTITGVTASNKVYDGTNTAALTVGTLSGKAAGDVVTLTPGTGTFSDKNIGTAKAVIASGYSISGTDANNYTLGAQPSGLTATINALQLTVGTPGISLSKQYDTNNNAAVTAGTLSGVLPTEAANVTLNPVAIYNNSTVGTGKTITVTYTLSGSAKDNYIAPVSSSVTTGEITALPLTASAPTITLSKVYDGTTSATVAKGTLSGVLAADVANVSLNAVATYDNATEGTGKTITVTYTLSGSAKDNYTAPASTSVATGVITAPVAIPLTVSAPTITLSKVYDGIASAAVTKGTLSGVLAADVANVTLVPTGAYDNATVGTGKTITVTYSLTGSAASKYIAPASSSVTTGEITKKSLTASAPTITLSKVYDGTTSATVTKGTLSGVLAADVANVTLVPTGAYDNATVGTGKTITVTYSLTGSAADNYTAPGSTSVTTGEIVDVPKIQLTVADPTNTFSKEYDGTNTAVVVAGALSGVAAADVNNVILNPIGTYDDASAGTGKAVTVKYTLSGSAANKYTIAPITTYSNGEIKRKQLNVSNVKVVTNKGVDGNTMAVVSYNGDLQDVVSVDANKVSVKAVANYDNASVGVNKTITVVYALSGTSKDNYIAPKETLISNGEIADVIALNALETSQTMSCEGSDLVLMYRVISGTPTKWRFSYDGAAQVAGVNTSAYNNLSTPDANGTISIVIPTTGMLPGNYKGSLQVQSESGVESPAYTFQFTVNVSSDNVVKMYDDVVACDNKSNRFVAYQWYKNGFAINGATKQFYCEKDGLNGIYSVQVATTDGQMLTTCSKTFASPVVKKVNAYPNPIKSNQALTVQATGFDNLELENSTLSVYDTFGTLVYQSTKVENVNMLNLPLAPKIYVGHIKLKNGSDYVFKVIVE